MKKTILAALISAHALSAQSTYQSASTPWPDAGLPDCFPGGYNAPAGTELLCAWDVFATGGLLYWHVSQDYMDVGRSAAFTLGGAVPAPEAVTEYPDFDYKPGFKVGLGLNSSFDGWYLFSEYTWLHQETRHLSNSLPSTLAAGDRVWIPNDWFSSLSVSSQAQAAALRTHWKLNFDMIDLGLCRPFYEGQYFTVRPNVQMRALFIRQLYRIDAYNAADLAAPPAFSLNRSQSWALGPAVGGDARWLLGGGFHMKGRLGFSLLFTRYLKLAHKEFDSSFAGAAAAPVNGSLAKYNCLRSITELGVGAGWGSYFADQRYHVNFSACYDFALLWAQNMMRETVSSLQSSLFGYPDPSGDLHLHGLTVDARLDF